MRIDSGENIHRNRDDMYPNWTNGSCIKCNVGAQVLDLTQITGYQLGDKILGDMDECAWVVLCGVHFTDSIYEKIDTR